MRYKETLDILIKYIQEEEYKGYDLYDTLNSPFISKKFGNMFSVLSIQFQKRNPLNIRPLLGIKKEYNPKAMGLFLSAYSRLYKITKDDRYLNEAKFFFNWLKENYSKGYSGYCWGYNFPWASRGKYINKFSPTSVVTSFVCNGIFEYHSITGDESAKEILVSACIFLDKDIKKYYNSDGICFSYTTHKYDNCYNASLLAAGVFAKTFSLTNDPEYQKISVDALNYVLKKQKEDGRWNYSIDEETGIEREQIDFHQGYILNSIFEIKKYCQLNDPQIEFSLKKGLEFYKENQFFSNGRSLWRYPRKYPVDIHNQSQGIITFSYLSDYLDDEIDFSKVVADWTIENMRHDNGYFYFRKNKFYTNRISYMRWSQAWMFLALTYLIEKE